MGAKQKVTKADKQEMPKSLRETRQVVKKEPSKTFEERTSVAQPWLDKDGNQVNQ